MKRVIAGILLAAFLLSTAIGCHFGGKSAEPTPAPAEKTALPVEAEELTAEPTAVSTETPSPEPTEAPTPTPEPTDTPSPTPTPEPTPTPDPVLHFNDEFLMIKPGRAVKIELIADDPKQIDKDQKAEIRLADGTVVGQGKLGQRQKNSISVTIPAGSAVRTTLYLYLEGTDYPIHTKDIAVFDDQYEKIKGNYERTDNMVAFTFDCAYGDANTDWLLDTLKKYNIHATFFMTGEWMSGHGKWIERIIEEGHEIGNHSQSHPNFKGMSEKDIYRQINLPNERMLEEHGYRIHLFRPPYGWSGGTAHTISRYLGCEVIQWGQTSKDATESWKGDQIIKLLLKETEPGDIILCHNAAKELRNYLVPVIEEFIARGYTFGTVSELMGWTWDDTYTAREAMDLGSN